MGDSDFCDRPASLTGVTSLGNRLDCSTVTDLPAFTTSTSSPALPADPARVSSRCWRLSRRESAAFAQHRRGSARSGAYTFGAHSMGFTFVRASELRSGVLTPPNLAAGQVPDVRS